VLARGAALAHQPDLLVPRKMQVRAFSGAHRGAIRDPHPHGGKGRLQGSFGAALPDIRAPRLPREHVLGGPGPEVRDGSLARTPARRHQPREPDLRAIDLLGARNPAPPNRPGPRDGAPMDAGRRALEGPQAASQARASAGPIVDCVGELVQIEGSEHWWFEGRGPNARCSSTSTMSSRLLLLKFVPTESTFDDFQATCQSREADGKPVAFHSDKHATFGVNKVGATGGDDITQ
jgi:hypothetical protein